MFYFFFLMVNFGRHKRCFSVITVGYELRRGIEPGLYQKQRNGYLVDTGGAVVYDLTQDREMHIMAWVDEQIIREGVVDLMGRDIVNV